MSEEKVNTIENITLVESTTINYSALFILVLATLFGTTAFFQKPILMVIIFMIGILFVIMKNVIFQEELK